MAFLALLSDRSPAVALPALGDLLPDLKLEPLSLASLDHVVGFDPSAVLVDAVENPAQAWTCCRNCESRDDRVPAMLIVDGISSSATPGTRSRTSSCTRERRRASCGFAWRCSDAGRERATGR